MTTTQTGYTLLRSGTTAEWAAEIPHDRQLIYNSDSNEVKLGDGVTDEASLTPLVDLDALSAALASLTTSVAGKAPLLEGINLVAASGAGTVAIPDPVATGKTYSKILLTGNCTLTLPTVPQAGVISISLLLIQDATGGRTPTLPAITWVGGSAPTVTPDANAATLLSLWTEGSSGGWFGVA